jgi:3-methyl-2-oxobutanoate hydroxymethyltransferase
VSMYHNRPTVADMRAMKARGQKISMLMLGMDADPWADAQYLFAEDVLGYNPGHKPRHSKTYRNFRAKYDRLQQERISAFKELIADIQDGTYPEPKHVVPIKGAEFETFLAEVGDQT